MQFFVTNLIASAYGEGSYSECDYNVGCVETNTPGSGTNGAGLADTGVWVIALVTLACLLIFTALLVRWAARRNRKSTYRASNTTGASRSKS